MIWVMGQAQLLKAETDILEIIPILKYIWKKDTRPPFR